jgi:hypothetical protein
MMPELKWQVGVICQISSSIYRKKKKKIELMKIKRLRIAHMGKHTWGVRWNTDSRVAGHTEYAILAFFIVDCGSWQTVTRVGVDFVHRVVYSVCFLRGLGNVWVPSRRSRFDRLRGGSCSHCRNMLICVISVDWRENCDWNWQRYGLRWGKFVVLTKVKKRW